MQMLICRPIDDSIKLAKIVNELGYKAIISPLLEIKYFEPFIDQASKTYIITSRHALKALSNREVKLVIAGEETYALALASGFNQAIYAGANAKELKNFLHKTSIDFLEYLSASDVTDSLSEFPHIKRIIIYQAQAMTTPTKILLDFILSEEPRAALFFSLRTAEIFTKLFNNYRRNSKSSAIITYSLSEKISDYLKFHGFSSSDAAPNPNLTSLIGIIDKLK